MVIKVAHYLLIFLVFIIPVAWWTRLNANYYSTKLTLLFLAGALAWLAIPYKVKLLKLPKVMLSSLAVIVLYQIIFHTYTLRLDDFLHLFKFLSFSGLVFWIYSQDLDLEQVYEKSTYAIFATISVILGISLYEFYIARIVNLSTDISVVLSTFGNVNMFAEFLILSVPFLFHWTRYKDKLPAFLKLFLFSLWLFFILYSRSRSAWIGLALWSLLLFKIKPTKKELIFIGFALGLYLINNFTPSLVNNLNAIKQNNTSGRLSLYAATYEMIKDHPWGIRAGAYMGEIEVYQMGSQLKPTEFNYYDQPHSEFLKWGAQFGWFFLVFVFILFISILWQLYRWFLDHKGIYFIESFLVLLPQILFQFPFENPASLVYLSLVVALFFKEYTASKTISLNLSYRLTAIILFLAGLYSSVGFVFSVYQESTMPRNENIILACEYYPINVKACHAKLAYYLDNKKYDEFVKDFKVDFMKEPFFVDYLRLLPTYYSIKQNGMKTCQSLFLYKTIFPEQKSFDQKYYAGCSGVPDTFYFDNPKRFKARYMTWLDQLN